jgi:hypothetical protein
VAARFNHAGRLYYLGTFPTAAAAATAEARGLMLAEAGMMPREVREAVRRGWLLTLPELRRVVPRFVVMPAVPTYQDARPFEVLPWRDGDPPPHLILMRRERRLLIQSPRARRLLLDRMTCVAAGPYTIEPPRLAPYGQVAAEPDAIRRLMAVAVLSGLTVALGELGPGRSAR